MGSIITKAKNIYKTVKENHITKAGGTITKTAEQIDLYTTEEGIGLYSNTSTQYKTEGMLIHGTSGEVPELSERNAIVFDCVVEVYRSAKHREGASGKKDITYKGTFGFDSYNEDTNGKGYKAINSYEKIILKRNPYYVPWLSLWPSKIEIDKLPEIKKDSTFNPATSCTLFFKIKEGNNLKKNKGDLLFLSSDENLKISGKKIYELKDKSVEDDFSLSISCSGIISKNATIDIYETSTAGKVVGKIKVLANGKIGIAKVHFVPIEYEQTTTNKRRLEKAANKTEEFNVLVNGVLEYLNTQAFNQSLIFLSATKETKVINLPKDIVETKNEGAYSASISKAYFDGIPEHIEAKKNKKEISTLNKAIRKYYKAVLKKRDKLKKNSLYCYDTMNNIDKELKKNYKAAHLAYLATLGGETLINGHKKEDDTIYVFIHKDLETLNVGSFKYSGYAYHGGNNAFIFNKPLKNKNYGVFAHEIAHVMGLDHTFELNAKQVNVKVDKELGELEKELKNKKENTGAVLSSNRAVSKAQKGFNDSIKNLGFLVSGGEDGYSENKKVKAEGGYYTYINKLFSSINKMATLEFKYKGLQSTLSPLTNTEKSIVVNKLKQKENLKRVINVSQSYTQENFMDYDSLEADNSSSTSIPKDIEYNDNFYYKSFWKWQWDKMKVSKFIKLKQL